MTHDASSAPAGPATGGPGLGRYLASSADPAVLTEALTAHPQVRVLRHPTADLVAIEATGQAVTELRESGIDGLVIEPDRALDAMPPVGPGSGGAPAR